MDIDTRAIRRLRDALFAEAGQAAAGGPAPPPDVARAILARAEPFAETMCLVMLADGEPAEPERRMLLAALGVLTGGQVGAAELAALLDRVATRAAAEGIPARVMAVGTRLNGDRDDRETAFTLAAAVALADEHVAADENGVLALIREYFGVSDRRAAALLDAAAG